MSEEQIARMCGVLSHRGPDDYGVYTQGSLGIGMRRLSIIDPTSGHQPISNEDNSLQLVFNGEIYNYLELRSELRKKGHVFKTDSDTEVILHAYEQWGYDSVKKFIGMFAFAIWDSNKRHLYVARDPLGIKPLHYWDRPGGTFLFSSEIKSMIAVSGQPTLSVPSINQYFAHGFVYAPNSIYEDIKKLLPGEYAVVPEKGNVLRHRYWRIRPNGNARHEGNEAAYIDELLDRLKESVRLQLRSDVPVGAFLSGGVDSSSIVACMGEVSDQQVHTFSIGFREPRYDESPYARAVADRLGTIHRDYILGEKEASDVLPVLAYYFDEPFADSSAIPTYYVSKHAREHVTVALSGDGADELFAGYDQCVNERLVQSFRRLPAFLRGPVLGVAIDHLPSGKFKPSVNYLIERVKKVYGDALLSSPGVRFFRKSMIAREALRKELFTESFLRQADTSHEAERLAELHCSNIDHGDAIADLLDVQTSVQLPDDMLTKVDRASMANSLEVRVPFLDHTFVEFAASLPTSMKLNGLEKKYILKKALCRYLPEDWVNRRKQGFSVPLDSWFRGGLSTFALRVLEDSGVLGSDIISRPGVETIIGRHRSGERDHSAVLYALVFFSFWYERWCAGTR